jgi:hypothetical protein
MTDEAQESPLLAPAMEAVTNDSPLLVSSKAGMLLVGILAISLSAFFFSSPDQSPPSSGSSTTHNLKFTDIKKGDGGGIVVPIDLSESGALDKAISQIQVPEPERDRIRNAVTRGELGIGTMRVWDYAVQDGDVITVMTAGFVQTITIAHTPTLIVIPHRGAGIGRISAVGAPDLYITVAVGTSLGSLKLIPLEIGQSVEVSYP